MSFKIYWHVTDVTRVSRFTVPIPAIDSINYTCQLLYVEEFPFAKNTNLRVNKVKIKIRIILYEIAYEGQDKAMGTGRVNQLVYK